MVDVKIVCEDEKYMPEYATEFDACMDLKIKVDNADKEVVLFPNEKYIFSTGIQVAIPKDYAMLLYPRSSTGIKLNCMLCNTTGVIDSMYRDTVKLALYNFGKTPILLQDGQRIAQFMVIPRPKINLIRVQDDKDFREGDRRGGIGSTGK